MFLDEQLEKIYSETQDLGKCVAILNESWGDKATDVTIKRADNVWRLFAKRHPELNEDGYAKLLLKRAERLSVEAQTLLREILNVK